MMFCATDGLQKYSISIYKYVFRAKSMKFFIGFAQNNKQVENFIKFFKAADSNN